MYDSDDRNHSESRRQKEGQAVDTTSFAYRLQWLYDHQADPRTTPDQKLLYI